MNKCVIKVDIEVLEVETDLAGLIQKGEFILLIMIQHCMIIPVRIRYNIKGVELYNYYQKVSMFISNIVDFQLL